MSVRSRGVVVLAALVLGGCELRSLVSLPVDAGEGPVGCAADTTPCGGACVFLQNDLQNCGACGVACPAADSCVAGVCRKVECVVALDCPRTLHAPARCEDRLCLRGPCEKGFFDFDGAATRGCEASCAGRVCTLGDGGVVTTTSEPLAETGLVFQVMASGSSFGAQVQTSAGFTNVGVLGEPTPPLLGGGFEQKSPGFRNVGGFGSIQGK